ncbi:MAG: type II toxin-antitoxin system PemK/MazF family toxin [Gammaproteobacteria bacterium]|nr:type II toxin-antitoxin system PemK/MazF family toxin [Gammaproteobacteria bacterium]
MTQKINSGEIWTANLDPRNGTEPGKKRPVLIIQDQTMLDMLHPSTIIIPLTTKLIDNLEPLRIRIKAQTSLKKDSDLLMDQIRAIDNSRLITGPIAKLDNLLMHKAYRAIAEILGIPFLTTTLSTNKYIGIAEDPAPYRRKPS